MPDASQGIGFTSFEDEVKSVHQTLGDLKKIEDQLNTAHNNTPIRQEEEASQTR